MACPPVGYGTNTREEFRTASQGGAPRPADPAPQSQLLTIEKSSQFRLLVRGGFVTRGITYGVVGGLVVALAAGAGSSAGEPANQQGALELISQAPLGKVALALAALGLMAYALWKLSLAVRGTGPEGREGTGVKDRVANFSAALVYVAFFVVALRVLVGSAGDGAAEQRQAASGVLRWSGGHMLVGGAAVVMLAISAYQAYAAARGEFIDENRVAQMSPRERRVFIVLGRVGLIGRSIVFLLVGYFLLRIAIDYKPSEGLGVDGALGQVHSQPLGPFLLMAVAAGLLVFAVFSCFEARYQRL